MCHYTAIIYKSTTGAQVLPGSGFLHSLLSPHFHIGLSQWEKLMEELLGSSSPRRTVFMG